jgi:hypothetical protein
MFKKLILALLLLAPTPAYAQTSGRIPRTDTNNTWTGVNTYTQNVTAPNIPSSISGTGSCTNQFVTVLNASAAPTCTTDIFAGPFHANQGTTSQVLTGNASGNPAWSAVPTGAMPALTGDVTSSAGTVATTVSKIQGTSVSTPTGTGAVVLATSPSISSPTTTGTDSGTETLSNKTLSSPTSTGTDSGTETLTNKTLTAPKIGTTTISEAPRFVAAFGFVPGNVAVGLFGSAFQAKAITVESITVHSITAATCSVNPTLRVRNGSSTVTTPTLTLTTGTADWSTTGNNVNYAAGDTLFLEVTSAGTCTTPPANIFISVTGRMQ